MKKALVSQTLFATLLFVAMFSMGAHTALAASSSGGINNPLNIGNCSSGTSNGQCITTFLTDILGFVVQIGEIAIILMLVFIGFKYVTAQGAPGKLEEIHRMLFWTIIGGLILLGAQAIASGIQATVQAL